MPVVEATRHVVGSFSFVGYFEDAINSLTWDKTNKVTSAGEAKQGVVSDLLPELTLEADDQELLKSTLKWTGEWDKFKTKENIDKRQEKGENYWKGKQMINRQRPEGDDNSVDNLVFEALETFLPIATRQNPEPVIESSINSEESLEFNNLLKEQLVWLSDEVKLRLKIKRAARHWALSLIGVIKMAWDLEKKIPVPYVIRPQKMILDPNSTIEEGKYTGAYIGEPKEESATSLSTRFPEKAEFIAELVKGEMGTIVRYIEWWTPEMVFWVLEKEVLGKMRNPHWDYGTTEEKMDEFGQMMPIEVEPINHFSSPQMPYCFLSVFNLGKQPVDDTSLIEQVIPMQDEVNRLNKQIAKNVAQMNGTVIVSSDSFNKDQSKSLADAVRDGRPVLVPGSVNEAYKRDVPPNIPGDVFGHRNDMRNELRGVFGVTGATAQGIANEDTVRGKILVREQDSTRIGGGISVFIEQLADDVYNWFVQMVYVYFDEQDVAMLLGEEKAMRFMELKPIFGRRRIRVMVKEGSLIPKDNLTIRNQAIELAGLNRITNEELYKALDMPDPKKMAQELYMESTGQLYAQPVPEAPAIEQPQVPTQPNPLSAVPIWRWKSRWGLWKS